MATLPQLEMPEGGDIARVPGGISREWRSFWRNPLTVVGVGLLGFLILFSWLGPVVYRTSDLATNLTITIHGPMPGHPLGTDGLGRDELARLMVGGQLSLLVGFAAAVVSMIIGTVYGLVSAQFGGWIDTIMMRVVDVLISLPTLFVLLLLDSIFSPTAVTLVFIIALFSWQPVARIVRSEVLSLRERDFVEAARAEGASQIRIMFRHFLPNTMGSIIVYTTFQVGNAILTVAALSFLSLGLPPPNPNWGQMLSDSMNYVFQNSWWLIYPPGLLIVFAELGVNFLGDSLTQAFDPRLRERS